MYVLFSNNMYFSRRDPGAHTLLDQPHFRMSPGSDVPRGDTPPETPPYYRIPPSSDVPGGDTPHGRLSAARGGPRPFLPGPPRPGLSSEIPMVGGPGRDVLGSFASRGLGGGKKVRYHPTPPRGMTPPGGERKVRHHPTPRGGLTPPGCPEPQSLGSIKTTAEGFTRARARARPPPGLYSAHAPRMNQTGTERVCVRTQRAHPTLHLLSPFWLK